MNELYNRIQDMAREKGLSIGALCDRAGVYKSRMTDLKSGRVNTLSEPIIRKLANTLGTTPDALLYGDNKARIFHLNLDEESLDARAVCRTLTDGELVDMLSAASAELQRRRKTREV